MCFVLHDRDHPDKLVPVEEAPVPTIQVLASCQALVVLDDGDLVGDPMEKATLKAIQWNPTKCKYITELAN